MKRNLIIACVLLLMNLSGYAQNSSTPNKFFDMGELEWRLWGYTPEVWRLNFDLKNHKQNSAADVAGIAVKVPGSVQKALLDAGIIENWNYGRNYKSIEWIEHRHWLFTTTIPDEWIQKKEKVNIKFNGLDDNGFIYVNGNLAGEFNNAFIPYTFDISKFLNDSDNTLTVVFNLPPRYLGQIGFTSKIKEWKPRFYYGWDWIPRIVQIGIWDNVTLEVLDKEEVKINNLNVLASANRHKDIGALTISTDLSLAAKKGEVKIELTDANGKYLINETLPAAELADGKVYNNLKVERWYPNGEGKQPLYALSCTLIDENGTVKETLKRRVGFKSVCWESNKNAPKEADKWICVVNDKPIFLQGINWTPIRPNFADLTKEDYKNLLQAYKEMGFNVIRIWGGGFPERDWLYDTCDELGLMIHQDFPLSSSGVDNYPPEDPVTIEQMSHIVRHYVQRNKHHVAIFTWCGGNELYLRGDTEPIKIDHPMIRRMYDIVSSEDPNTRFVPASPSGINITAGWQNFGSGKNWDTHGPWAIPYDTPNNDYSIKGIDKYWAANDALFISEMGAPGASPTATILKYKGDYEAFPANTSNPFWNQYPWWIQWDQYKIEHNGQDPELLEEFVQWSQQSQVNGLTSALRQMKKKFPQCGGLYLWMGHDCVPATANTSIIDFDGNWKPAAYELQKILKTKVEDL